MNKRIPNGAWCLFREDLGGSRGSRPVLVQHSKIMDPELGGQFTVKMYHSTKIETADGWKHTKIVLRPDSYFTHYKDIVLVEDDLDSFKVIGEFISVIG